MVFYTLISRAHLAHNLGNFYAVSRHATPTAHPRPDLSSFAPMGNQAPERHQGAQRPPHPRQRAGQPSHP